MGEAFRAFRWLCGAVPLGWLASAGAAGEPTACRVEIQIEEHPEAGALKQKLQEEARHLGACARPWRLRVSPGPRGQYVLALWNGTDLETRWAGNAREVEAVAEVLLRVAVEHADAEPPAAGPSASAPVVEPSASSAPPEPPSAASQASQGQPEAPPPGAAGEAPVQGVALTLGPWLGAGWYAGTGGGVEAGGTLRYGGAWGVGVQPGVGWAWGRTSSRTEVRLLLVGSYRAAVGQGTWLGVGVGAGPGMSWARDTRQGIAEDRGVGLVLGFWPEARLGERLWLGLPVRYSTTTAPIRYQTTQQTTEKNPNPNAWENPGKGTPEPPGKTTTTTTTTTTALPSAAGHLGGWSVALQVGWMF